MSRHASNEPQTFNEMMEYGENKKNASKLYKAENAEFIDGQLYDLINNISNELVGAGARDKISLSDTKAVKNQSLLYLCSCSRKAILPSMAGLAKALGTTRQALYSHISRRSPAETATWLEQCKDCFADALSVASLRGCCNPVLGIFLLKAQFSMRETSTLEVTTVKPIDPLGPLISQENLEAALADLPDD